MRALRPARLALAGPGTVWQSLEALAPPSLIAPGRHTWPARGARARSCDSPHGTCQSRGSAPTAPPQFCRRCRAGPSDAPQIAARQASRPTTWPLSVQQTPPQQRTARRARHPPSSLAPQARRGRPRRKPPLVRAARPKRHRAPRRRTYGPRSAAGGTNWGNLRCTLRTEGVPGREQAAASFALAQCAGERARCSCAPSPLSQPSNISASASPACCAAPARPWSPWSPWSPWPGWPPASLARAALATGAPSTSASASREAAADARGPPGQQPKSVISAWLRTLTARTVAFKMGSKLHVEL